MRTLALLLILVAPVAGGDAPGGTVIALNKRAASASIIDRATGKEVARIPTGTGPHEVAVTPDGKQAVVCNYGAGRTLSVIDIAAKKVVRTIDLGVAARPHGIQFLPGGTRMAVTAESRRALFVVDFKSGKVVATVPTEQAVSHMVAVAPDGKRAYVANIGSGSLSVLDLENGKLQKIVPTGAGAEGVAVRPGTGEIWVSNRAANTVSVIDPKELKVVATLKAVGFPIRVYFTPKGEHALVSCAFAGEVWVFDAAQRSLVKKIALHDKKREDKGNMFRRRGPLPIGMCMPADGKHVFVACGGYDEVAVLDTKQWTVVGRHPTGREPDGLAWTPVTPAPPPAAEK
ncbi:MAG: YncE family protein [Planctomycetota bacterium]|nr:YncE family protein [Planctomycetota bacterium]